MLSMITDYSLYHGFWERECPALESITGRSRNPNSPTRPDLHIPVKKPTIYVREEASRRKLIYMAKLDQSRRCGCKVRV